MRRPPRAVRSWSAVTVLSLVVFLLILLWLGRRKGSENIAQTKIIESMQAELKIVVRDCEGWRDQILRGYEVNSTERLRPACTVKSWTSLGTLRGNIPSKQDGGIVARPPCLSQPRQLRTSLPTFCQLELSLRIADLDPRPVLQHGEKA